MPEVRKTFFDFIKTINCSFEAVVARKTIHRYENTHKGKEEYFYADLLSHLKIIVNSLQDQINQLKAMIVSSSNTNQSTLISSGSLAQNIPNPFSSTTTIGYNLPTSYSSASIMVTDAKGVVLKLISLNSKGKGNVQLDASTLASGAYRYSLYIDGRMIDSKQMVSSK